MTRQRGAARRDGGVAGRKRGTVRDCVCVKFAYNTRAKAKAKARAKSKAAQSQQPGAGIISFDFVCLRLPLPRPYLPPSLPTPFAMCKHLLPPILFSKFAIGCQTDTDSSKGAVTVPATVLLVWQQQQPQQQHQQQVTAAATVTLFHWAPLVSQSVALLLPRFVLSLKCKSI